ncbi:hypothetical protein [Kitasatospora sp. NPDC093102]|uniref:hypothetical protein n=1 Tax=Kitasatospora sp. NPDC093102 TaxID=3155069 RepID=UPI00342C1395
MESSNPSRQEAAGTPLDLDPVWAARISKAGQHPQVRTVNALTDEEIAAWWEPLPPVTQKRLSVLVRNAADFTRLQPGTGDSLPLRHRLAFAGALSLLSMGKPEEAISATTLLKGKYELTPGAPFREYDEREKVAFHEGASRQALASGIPKLALPGGSPPPGTRIPRPPSHAGPSSRTEPPTRRQTAGPGEPPSTGRLQETAPATPSNPKRALDSPEPSPTASSHKRQRSDTPRETTRPPVRTDPGPAVSIVDEGALSVAVELMTKFGITTENGQPHASDPLTRDVALHYTLAKKSLHTVITDDVQRETIAKSAATEPIRPQIEAFETAIELMKEHKAAPQGEPHEKNPLTHDIAHRYLHTKNGLPDSMTDPAERKAAARAAATSLLKEVLAREAAAELIRARAEAFETAIELMKEHKIALRGEPHEKDPLTHEIALGYRLAKEALPDSMTDPAERKAAAREAAANLLKATDAHNRAVAWALEPDQHTFGTLGRVFARPGIASLDVPLIDVPGALAQKAGRGTILVPTEHGWHLTDSASGRARWQELLHPKPISLYALQLPVHEPTEPAVKRLLDNTRRTLEKHLGITLLTAPPGSRISRTAAGELQVTGGTSWVGGLEGLHQRQRPGLPQNLFTDRSGRLSVPGQPAFLRSPAGLGFTGGGRWEAAWRSLEPSHKEIFAINCLIKDTGEIMVPYKTRNRILWKTDHHLHDTLRWSGAGPDRPIQLLLDQSDLPSNEVLKELARNIGRPLIVPDSHSAWDASAVHDGMIRVGSLDGLAAGRWRMFLPPDHRFRGMHLWTDPQGKVFWPPRAEPQVDHTWESLTPEHVTATVDSIIEDWRPREPAERRASNLSGPKLREELEDGLHSRVVEGVPLTVISNRTLEQFDLDRSELSTASMETFRSLGHYDDPWNETLAERLEFSPEVIAHVRKAVQREGMEGAEDTLDFILEKLQDQLLQLGVSPDWLTDADAFLDATTIEGTAALKALDLFDRHGASGLVELERRLRNDLLGEPPEPEPTRTVIGSADAGQFLIRSTRGGTEHSRFIQLVSPKGQFESAALSRLDDGPGAVYAVVESLKPGERDLGWHPLPWTGPTLYIDVHGRPGIVRPEMKHGLATATTGAHLADLVVAQPSFLEMWEQHGTALNVVLNQCYAAEVFIDGPATPDAAGSPRQLVAARDFQARLIEEHRMPLKVYATAFKASFDTELGVKVPDSAAYDPKADHWQLFEPPAEATAPRPTEPEDMDVDVEPVTLPALNLGVFK